MLKLNDLDNRKYQELWNDILNSYKAYSGEQTRYEASDPGITILEVFTLLYDMQNYYRNCIDDKSRWALLKSLGIRRRSITPSKGYIELANIEESICLPSGMKFYAQETIFETEKAYTILENSIKRVIYGGQGCNIAPMLKLESNVSFSPLNTHSKKLNMDKALRSTHLTIELEKEVPIGSNIILYIGVKNRNNSFKYNVIWEYESCEGFIKACICEDTTNNLNNTGIINMLIDKKMKRGRYFLRAEIIPIDLMYKEDINNCFPVISEVKINALPITQKDTISKSICLKYMGDKIKLCHYLAYSGEIIIFVKNTDLLWHEETNKFNISRNRKGETQIYSDKLFDVEIKIIFRKNDYSKYYKAAHITGGSTCRVELIDLSFIEEELRLQLKEGEALYRDYKLSEKMNKEGSCPYGFVYDEDSQCLTFGNGRNYKVPKRAQEGCMITDLVLCGGSQGNVAANKINSFAYIPLTSQIKCNNAMPTIGGKQREGIWEAIERAGVL